MTRPAPRIRTGVEAAFSNNGGGIMDTELPGPRVGYYWLVDKLLYTLIYGSSQPLSFTTQATTLQSGTALDIQPRITKDTNPPPAVDSDDFAPVYLTVPLVSAPILVYPGDQLTVRLTNLRPGIDRLKLTVYMDGRVQSNN